MKRKKRRDGLEEGKNAKGEEEEGIERKDEDGVAGRELEGEKKRKERRCEDKCKDRGHEIQLTMSNSYAQRI